MQTCPGCASVRACVCWSVSTCASVHGASCMDVCACCGPGAELPAWGPETEGKGKVVQAREIQKNFKEKKQSKQTREKYTFIAAFPGKEILSSWCQAQRWAVLRAPGTMLGLGPTGPCAVGCLPCSVLLCWGGLEQQTAKRVFDASGCSSWHGGDEMAVKGIVAWWPSSRKQAHALLCVGSALRCRVWAFVKSQGLDSEVLVCLPT